MKFNVLHFSSSVNWTPSDFSQSSDAHCSTDSICLAVLCLLSWSCEIIIVIGDACWSSRTPDDVVCVSLIFETLIACLWMLQNHFCPIFSLGGVGSRTHTFEMAHFWINVFRAGDIVTRFASRLEFEIHKISEKQTIRIVCSMIAVQLTLLL